MTAPKPITSIADVLADEMAHEIWARRLDVAPLREQVAAAIALKGTARSPFWKPIP